MSSPEFLQNNLDRIRTILRKNNYPTKIQERISSKNNEQQIQEEGTEENFTD